MDVVFGHRTTSGGALFKLGHHGTLWTVAASPDGRWFVDGAKNGRILVWEVATKQRVPISFHGHEGMSEASYSYQTMFVSSDDGRISPRISTSGLRGILGIVLPKLSTGTDEHIIVWNIASMVKI